MLSRKFLAGAVGLLVAAMIFSSGCVEAEDSKGEDLLEDDAEVIEVIDIEAEARALENAPASSGGRVKPAASRGVPQIAPAPPGIDPLYVRELTEIEQGHNDSSPIWSLTGEKLAFERTIGDKQEIIIALPDGSEIHKVYYKQADKKSNGYEFFLPGLLEETSYNAGISWAPDGTRFVFMSNGGTGNYDLYVGSLGSETAQRLTTHKEKDGHAHWSPVDDRLVYISGRTGKADIYLSDLASGETEKLTEGSKAYLYPRWSPDGVKVAMIYGSNENHDIYLIGNISSPTDTTVPLTEWPYDDLSPSWSPDGKRIAFYTNYNSEGDPKVWSLVVVESDGSGPRKGKELAARVVASDVVPDVESGPAWMPDSRRLVYVKDDKFSYNPLYIVDVEERRSVLLRTGTKMNHDVACSANGTIAFRAQEEQWDHIYIARLRK